MRYFLIAVMFLMIPLSAQANSLRIVALGDSLTSGYGLTSGDSFTKRLEAALVVKGINAKVENAGVAGDTSAGGLSRLDWAVAGDIAPDLVIVSLGANDMLRGIDPKTTHENLSKVILRLKEKNIKILLVGMKSSINMLPSYRKGFDDIYPELAAEHNVPLYPFFLQDVVMRSELNQDDGIHPNEKGLDVIVKNILPYVEKSLKVTGK